MKQIKDYYCENCFQEHLKEWIEQDDGTIVCSKKCEDELSGLKEVINKPKRRKNGKNRFNV
jgi:hypothetical protein